MKKAQITLVMIIGVILILTVAAVLTITSQKAKLKDVRYRTFSEIQKSVEDCIRNALFYSSYYLTTKGGYIIPIDSFKTPFGNISYALKNGSNVFVGIDVLKTEIAIMVNELVPICTADVFQKLPQYKITTERPLTDIMFTRDSIEAIVDYKITAKQEEKQRIFERFVASVPIRMSYLYSEIDKMLDNAINDNEIDLTYLNRLDFDVRIIPYGNNKLFIVLDEESTVNNLAFPFLFVVK